MTRLSIAALTLTLGSGCRTPATSTAASTAAPAATPAAAPDGEAYPGTLLPPEAMGPDIQWRQRVTAQWDDRTETFEAVLSKHADELLMVGLGPMDTPGFVLRLHEGEIELDNRTRRELPFPARYILLDVQRVFFPWLPGSPPARGERSGTVHGELITERFAGGRLVERTFQRADARPPGEIAVHYRRWDRDADAAALVELDNGWFGYRLTIETLTQQRLP